MRLRPLREVRVEGGICSISLSQGKVAICDAGDYNIVSVHNWYASKGGRTFYGYSNVTLGSHRQGSLKMHRLILGLTDSGVQVDHIDGNGLNNCRSNLRVCTKSENQRNSRLRIKNSSGVRGVNWYKSRKMWIVRIQLFNKRKHLGYFNTKEEAVAVYNEAVPKYHGPFGKLNVV